MEVVLERWDPRVGRRIGGYDIDAVLGRGGMGVVYRARAEDGRVVALKLMAPELIESDEYRARFVQEAAVGPRLDHPHIVPVYGSGEADGELFIAMQLVEGRHLKKVIKDDGPLEPKRAVRLFRQAASALDAAHETGIVHRDVKPQNILVTDGEPGEHVYLTDFGLVKPMTSESSSSRTAHVFGTVPYLAPELIEALPADGRTDVYALGCVMFEALTGSVPFERENEAAALWAHVHETPPVLTDLRPDVPAGLNDVVFKALSKHPDDRFLTCGEFAAELESGLKRHISKVKYVAMREIVARVPRKKTERDVWSPNFFPELSRIRSASQRIRWWKVAAFTAACLMAISVQTVREGGIPRAIADTASGVGEVGSAVVDIVTGEDEETDPRVVAQVQGQTLERIESLGSGDVRALVNVGSQPPKGGIAREQPASASFVITNGRIAFHRFQNCNVGCDVDIYSVDPDGSHFENLTPGSLLGSGPQWSPDGATIMFSGWQPNQLSDIWMMDSDGSGLRNVTQTPGVAEGSGSWSPNGKRIVFAARSVPDPASLWIMASDGSDRIQITQSEVGDGLPDWAPTGAKIVFERGGCPPPAIVACGSGSPEIYTIDVDGTDLKRLTDGRAPRWSPDGSAIAFQSDFDVYVMRPSGNAIRNLTESGEAELSPDWSPDGRFIVFQYTNIIARVSLRTGNVRMVTDLQTANAPAWQPLRERL